ncbi:flavin-binding family monooxygenase [Acinetobacter sp. HA]|nr:flavin-binding family monooxygenase [Acinetobacter sp. HA]
MEKQVDILIVGAGISGIGLAVHLSKNCPKRSFEIIERRESVGGTWDLFKYPGIRSDSDMSTFGFNFKPWKKDQRVG